MLPRKVPVQPHLYEYPLLALWGVKSCNQVEWLNRLTDKGWLEHLQLENRARFSPCCHSSRLNYLDTCPSCQSIDFQLQTCLHCFNCGHIGAETQFRKQSGLECPNCYQSLRHIGVDYDRPIENHVCKTCHTMFAEAPVSAQCLECNELHELSALVTKNFYSYGLSLAGQLLARQGVVANLFADSEGNQMSLAQFCWLAQWQNKLAKRHGQTHTILSVKLTDGALLSERGMPLHQLETLQERICSIVRTTDACTQYTEEGMLFLLPFTLPGCLSSLISKFTELQETFTLPLHFDFRAVGLPADTGMNFQQWLMASLAQSELINR
ncbi:hypothetical protein L2750_13430 [Shewanella submarina]|nr:hypothetical protein [Shewanella submarina]